VFDRTKWNLSMNDSQRAGFLHGGSSAVETSPQIAWLRACAALIRLSTPLWPLWWPLLLACEARADRTERVMVAPPPARPSATIIDLAEWRCRHHAGKANRMRSR
jgi:hypothetical protein